MTHVIKFKDSIPEIGLFTRKPVKGPEQELVEHFIPHVTTSFRNKDTSLAVFYEPKLDTGFPDIVFVEFCADIFSEWKEPRSYLLPVDLKVLHHLYCVGGSNSETLENQLGIKDKNLIISLERLLNSKLIRRYAKQWKPYQLKHTFAIKRIVAVEAKIEDWKSAFQQAEINTWFASESYVLSPVSSPTTRIVNISQRLGLGIYTFCDTHVNQVTQAVKGSLPSCYAAWMFNEWIGRRLRLHGMRKAVCNFQV